LKKNGINVHGLYNAVEARVKEGLVHESAGMLCRNGNVPEIGLG